MKAPLIQSEGHPSSWVLSVYGEGGEGPIKFCFETVALIRPIIAMCVESDTIIDQYCSCLVQGTGHILLENSWHNGWPDDDREDELMTY